jgi:PGF-CTERM protein
MRRRALLRATAGVGTFASLVAGLPGSAAATDPHAQSSFGPLGSVTIPSAKEVAVDEAGAYAYVATTSGFAVVDLADPSSPVVVFDQPEVAADVEDGPVRQIFDVKLDPANDLLVVVGPAQGAGSLDGFATYDVSDPTKPSRVNFTKTPFFNHNCDVSEGVVYLCGNDGQRNALVAHDARSGERLGDWSVVDVDERWSELTFSLWPLHDVHVSDGVAYLAQWDAGTWVVDVSDPSQPSLVAGVRGRSVEAFLDLGSGEARREYIEPPGNDHYAAPDPSGDLLGISVESWDYQGDGTGGPGSVHLYDVSDPSTPTKCSELLPPAAEDYSLANEGNWTTSHNFELRDGLAFTSWYNGGVRLHDVSDPSSPQLLAAWRSEDTSFWAAQAATDSFFVASSHRDPTLDTPREGARLYTFPTVREPTTTPGGTVTPTPTPTSSPTPSVKPTPGTASSGPGDTPTPTPTASRTPSATDSPTGSPTGTDPATPDGSGQSGPGFGVVATLAALGLGAAGLLRREGRE